MKRKNQQKQSFIHKVQRQAFPEVYNPPMTFAVVNLKFIL